jgi:RNA polymerase sigma-70 factor, ECF subfamily
MEFSDQALMHRWQRGDAAAFEVLVRRWEGPVARFLARYSNNPEQTADGLQEVFLRVYRAGHGYRPKAAFSTWLFQIALNVARDAARRHRPMAPLDGYEPIDDAEPSATAFSREAKNAVDRALARLPEPLRVVLVLRHYQGMSFEEMSRVCATPASTLKSRFAVALEKLRSLLQPLESDFKESPS